ncbi:MAG TPA: hypothetical protein VHC97_18725 [Thermoanaerobaculia bacterium]|jgi:photosystem II stability/assembly factor-like uncharacterized protein|nr:hypothetical protein [Thermoanaerobaculia bacterium]
MTIPRCLTFLAVLLAPAFLAAQAPVWQPLGPNGGTVLSLTADPVQPGVLYATAGVSGVFKSTDRGASWRNVLVGTCLGNVAVDPMKPSVLYALCYPGVVWKSGDGGAHWAAVGRGLPPDPFQIRSVTVDPVRRNRVYLASTAGVWRSLDGGASWQPPSELHDSIQTFLAVRRPAGTAFAGTGHALYRTTDGGDSWKLLSRGIPGGSVNWLAASAADPQTVYALVQGVSEAGLYRTTNGGNSWRRVVEPPVVTPAGLQALTSLAADPRSPSILYATLSNGDVLRSTDGARSWSTVGRLPGPYPVDLTPDPFAARVLYAGLDFLGGVFRSDDGGATWRRRSQGYTAHATFSVSVAPADPEQVWTATLVNQVFRSGNGGRRWVQAAAPGPLFGEPSTLAAVSGSTAFALTRTFSPFEILLWRTEDAGASWQPVSPPSLPAISAIRAAPSDVSTLYTLEQSGGPGGGADVSRTVDGGDTWETRATGLGLSCRVGDLAVAPSTASVLYVTGAAAVPPVSCQNPAARVLRSRDGGATWTDASAGLRPGFIARVSVDPVNPDVLYAGYGPYLRDPGDGVWKSTDGGATWKRAGSELAGQPVAALLATAPGRVYAALFDGRVFRSTDAGASWQNVSAGLRAVRVYELAASPSDPDRVYAATTSGVWVLEED